MFVVVVMCTDCYLCKLEFLINVLISSAEEPVGEKSGLSFSHGGVALLVCSL